ncbi:hypothetical protein ABZ780_08860 [Micromonospora sp. NPDC047467]|uniref:hypothetical protein n=1 Tax=Micromonospora sp. NPDC047467 TaxID=3154814 RepID=UPI0033C98845
MRSRPERGRPAAAVGAVIVVLVAAGVVAWGVATRRDEPASTAGAVVEQVLTTLPPQLQPPATAVDLPTDRGVGTGALIYHPKTDPGDLDPTGKNFEQHDIYLVTVSGEQFRIGRTPPNVGPLNLSLSPDGRWLATKRDGRWRVRDLSGTTEHEVMIGYELSVWSTDARSVLLVKPDEDSRDYAAMALPDGEVRPLGVRTSGVAWGVAFIDGRELAVYEWQMLGGTSASSELTIKLTDVVTLVTRTLTLGGQTPSGRVPDVPVFGWHAGGSPTAIWAQVNLSDPRSTGTSTGLQQALLGVDVTTGAATTRIEMTTIAGQTAEWFLGVVAEGVVLQRTTTTNTELVVVDPHNGTRRVVTTFPGLVDPLVPGAQA